MEIVAALSMEHKRNTGEVRSNDARLQTKHATLWLHGIQRSHTVRFSGLVSSRHRSSCLCHPVSLHAPGRYHAGFPESYFLDEVKNARIAGMPNQAQAVQVV